MSLDYIRDTYGVPTEPVQPVPYESMTQGTFHPLGRPDLHVCPRHDFDFVADPKTGCPKCNAAPKPTEQSATQAGAGERYREQCAKGGRCLQGCLKAEQCFYAAPTEPAQPATLQKWIDDPHDIEQGRMLNPAWLALHGLAACEAAAATEQPATQAGAGIKLGGCPSCGRADCLVRSCESMDMMKLINNMVQAKALEPEFGQVLADNMRELSVAAPTTEQPGDAEIVELIVRDCCETDPADPDRPETICIHVDHLRAILQSQFDAARAAHGKGGQG
jgi:hypothetical protein